MTEGDTNQLQQGLVAADKNNTNKASPALAFKNNLGGWYKSNAKSLLSKLGNQSEVDSMLAGFVFAINANPDLLECKFETVINCLIRSVGMGVSIGNPDEATILSFKNSDGTRSATLVPMYQGLIKIAYNSGLVRSINCGVVFEHDNFSYQLGTDTFLRHVPLDDDDSRGAMVSAWCVIKLAYGDPVIVVKNKKYIEGIKAKSPSAKSTYSPWNTSPEQMWLKTIIKVALKQAPKNAKLQEAISIDNSIEMGELKDSKPVIEVDSLIAEIVDRK